MVNLSIALGAMLLVLGLAPLSTGDLTGYVIECPLHYACFDVRTGKLLSGPVSGDVATYQVQVEGDTVYVKR